MFIKSISIDNWKVFSERIDLDFNTIEIFSFPNGAGKTSVLEAIYYGLWGKVEGKLASYQNHEGQTVVTIAFEVDGVNYSIEREFPKNKAVLYKEDEKLKDGIREVLEYMEEIAPYEITKRLWFKGDIADNQVLDFNFFKNDLLSEQLKVPNALSKFYGQLARSKQKEANAINVREGLRSLEEIDKDIAEITSKLKDKTSTSDREYAMAVQTAESVEEFKELKKAFSVLRINPMEEQDIRRWRNIQTDAVKKRLAEENSKVVDAQLAELDARTLGKIAEANNSHGKCIVCDGEWAEERSSYVKEVLSVGFKSNSVIEELEESLKFKQSHNSDIVDKSVRYHELERAAERMPNYQEVIDSYNKENDLLWEKLDGLNQERTVVLRNQTALERLAELNKEVTDSKEKKTFIDEYLVKATEYYTSALIEKANKTINRFALNGSCKINYLDIEDNALTAFTKEGKLYVNQLSRGEKTVVALAMVFAIRDIFAPGTPLIFDESFAGLSETNNYSAINSIKDSQEQIFVVTHNVAWVNFGGYDETTTNVRSSW